MNIMYVFTRGALLTERLRKVGVSVSVIFTAVVTGGIFQIGQVAAQDIEPGDIAPFEVVYEVGNHLMNAGTAQLSLTQDGDIWNYSLSTKPRGLLSLAGKGRIHEASSIRIVESDGKLMIQPQTYSYRQDEERRRAVDAVFNWDTKVITYLYRGEKSTETLDEPIIDRLSATLLMMNVLRHDFESLELLVFDTGRINPVAFTNEGNEILDTPLGNIDTIRVTNRNANGSSRETTTWFAPSLDYVPIKIEHRKRGELVVRLNLLQLDNRVTDITLEPSSD